MGTTALSANLDRNVVHCEYQRVIGSGESVVPVDLLFRVLHQYRNTAGQTQEIPLQEVKIPASYLQDVGQLDLSIKTQYAAVTIMNLRYLDGLFIELSEYRDGVLQTKKVQVLNGDEVAKPPEPSNVIKEREHEENVPPVIPTGDISIPEDPLLPILYLMSSSSLEKVQASARIYMHNGKFISQDFGHPSKVIYIENAIQNHVPNPAFLTPQATANGAVPQGYEVLGPGLIIFSELLAGPVANTRVLRTRVANPNLFTPMNTVSWGFAAPQPLPVGLSSLTFSVFYQVHSDHGITPFSDFEVMFEFFNASGQSISMATATVPVGPEGTDWLTLQATVEASGIPANATSYTVVWEAVSINDTDPFVLQWYLPQAESSPVATTRTLSFRIQDEYVTSTEIPLVTPLYLSLKTHHVIGTGIRGLVDTTHLLKNGFQWVVTSFNKMIFKLYDVDGNLVQNVLSSAFSAAENEEVEYGLYLNGTKVDFYLDGNLVSSSPVSYALSGLSQKITVGSLSLSNTTINSSITDFRVLKIEPT